MRIIMALIAAVSVFLTGCTISGENFHFDVTLPDDLSSEAESIGDANIDSSADLAQTSTQAKTQEVSYTLWNAYWALEHVDEQTEEYADHTSNVSFFAAYFDKDDQVFIPEETTDFYASHKQTYHDNGWTNYLTIVNDQILADGSSDLKSTELLYRLFADDDSWKTHAKNLVMLALENGYDGLEIDYENIKKDNELWALYMMFIRDLYDMCEGEGMKLRVVIEPSIETEKIPWVEGPTYSVMCYNLYGSHSEPGPKANKAFLEEMMEKMSYLPGKVDYALANGGFDWNADGTVTQITVSQAKELLQVYGTSYEIDKDSAAKYFSYTDENGASHEVWYGDEETLDTWMQWLEAGGNYDFSIWRLGD